MHCFISSSAAAALTKKEFGTRTCGHARTRHALNPNKQGSPLWAEHMAWTPLDQSRQGIQGSSIWMLMRKQTNGERKNDGER